LKPIPELWSEEDAKAEDALSRAARESDLLSALVAIDGLGADEAMRIAHLIAEWSVMVRLERDAGASARDALAAVLVQREGFSGDSDDYFAPDNSSIARALERRRAQPIVLSCLWMLVGQGAGIEVVGVGLPGHFVVGVEGLVVDPFAGGRFLSIEQCKELAARALPGRAFDNDLLAPVSVGAIAARVLRNLSHALRRRGDEPGVYRATRLLSALEPDDGPVWVELARQTEAHGAWPEALALYRHIARHFADRREGQIGELKAIELESRTRTLN
jgi:regulator of sirC expression with transglutaminase-like and TPR domain